MSTVKTNNVQIGQSLTASQNFTWYQPATPDGTVRLGNGNSGLVTDLVTLTSAGNLGIGTSSPGYKLEVNSGSAAYSSKIRSTTTYSLVTIEDATTTVGAGPYLGALANNLVFGRAGVAEYMRLDSSGNLGLGVTPSAWGSGIKAFQLANGPAFASVTSNTYIGNNWYNDGTNNRYISNSYATLYGQNTAGQHVWYIAPSGTAGNAISFTQAMTLDSSGNLLVGTTSTSGSTTNLTQTVGGVYSSLSGSGGSFTSGVAGTLFTMANINNGQTWLVTVTLDGEGIISYNCTYVVVGEGANAAVAQLYKGPNASISVSGLAVQYTQSSGGTKTNVRWSATRLL